MTTSPNSSSNPEQLKSGFTDSLKMQALQLKARIQSGETIPLEELRLFIQNANQDLEENRVKKAVAIKREDVDFF